MSVEERGHLAYHATADAIEAQGSTRVTGEDYGEVVVMALEDTTRMPSGRDLPSSDGVPMESDVHRVQASLYLIQPLQRHFEEIGFVAWVSGNSFVYYPGVRDNVACLGPDMYVVNGGVPRGQEKWVVWEEGGLMPTLTVELVSPSTVRHDRGRKFRIYRDVFRCPDYLLYNTTTQRLEAFRLEAGSYLSVLPDADGAFPCSSLPGLRLGVRDGWLRFILPDGHLLLTGDELAEQERARADHERRRTRREHQRAAEATARAAEATARAAEAGARAEEERQKAAEAGARAEEERQKAAEAGARAEEERQRAAEADARAEEERRKAEEVRLRLMQVEEELRLLRESARREP